MGARRLTTASSPITSAIFRAAPPVTQPPHVKPMIMVTTMEATQDQKTIVFVGRAALHFSPRLSVRFLCSIDPLPCPPLPVRCRLASTISRCASVSLALLGAASRVSLGCILYYCYITYNMIYIYRDEIKRNLQGNREDAPGKNRRLLQAPPHRRSPSRRGPSAQDRGGHSVLTLEYSDCRTPQATREASAPWLRL